MKLHEWLGVSVATAQCQAIRSNLQAELKRVLETTNTTQAELGARIGIKQPGVARAMRIGSNVSLDLLIRALLEMGVTRQRIAEVIADADYVVEVRFVNVDDKEVDDKE